MIDTVTLAVLGATTASYDSIGNIAAKSDVGVYDYDGIAAGPHALTQAGATAYGYDANGSMISATDTVTAALVRDATWSSFNKPVRIQDFQRNQASLLAYGPSRARVKQVVYAGVSPVKTITYAGGDFERHAFASGPDELVHYIRAGEAVAIYTKTDDGLPATDKTRYPHRDHLGSVDTVTDEVGLVVEVRSYDPWGKTRNPDWTPAIGDVPLTETRRGFTDHEHLDAVGLIHMNGRVYDPVIGRFLSADPSDATDPRVGFNRYSYVLNNPLSFTDPSGFLLKDSDGNVVFDPVGEQVQVQHPSGPTSTVQPGNVYADDGREIEAFKNDPAGNPGFDTDCHGYTFAGGDVWINDDQLSDILEGDNYAPTSKPEPGDVAVYTKDGYPVHSATVTDIDPITGEATVTGLGGMETVPHTDPATPGPGGAWRDPLAEFSYFSQQKKAIEESIEEDFGEEK